MLRIFSKQKLLQHTKISLDITASNHILNVMRLKIGDRLVLFDGEKGEFSARLYSIERKIAFVEVGDFIDIDRESLLNIHLVQGIARGEKMDYIIQKSVELGVQRITPIFTEYCNVKLPNERVKSRIEHWQKIIVSACEQSGRNIIPVIDEPLPLQYWMRQKHDGLKLILEPSSTDLVIDRFAVKPAKIIILIGPEGGFSLGEIEQAKQLGFLPTVLGPRILRTETAPVAIIGILQALFGDIMVSHG